MAIAYLYDILRTPLGRGNDKGALHEIKPIKLLSHLLLHLQQRHNLDTQLVNDVIIGCSTPVRDQGGNMPKAAVLHAGWSEQVPAMQINRFCLSGLEAINLAALKIQSGYEQLVVAGGVESMSRVEMGQDGGPFFFDSEINTDILYVPQGISADLIATREHYSRLTLDQYALESYEKARIAQQNGFFDKVIVPVKDNNGLVVLDQDEEIRAETTETLLSKLKSSFAAIGKQGYDAMAMQKYPEIEKIQHVHTAGNSSGIVDGAAIALIGSKAIGKKLGIAPKAKIIAIGLASDEPTIMLQGASPAIKKALEQAQLNAEDIDLWEINEAFAAQTLKCKFDFNIPDEKLNINGGNIAYGHPLGATGTILMGHLLFALEEKEAKYGVVALSGGGGMGIATIIERL